MDKQLKICLMNDSFPPLIDGVANAVLNYAHVLQTLQAECVVATPEYEGVTDDYPFPVVRYPSFNTTKLVGYRTGYPFDSATLNVLKKQKIDVIHSHCPLVSTLLARTLREMTGAPIVLTYHTKFDIDIKNAINARILQEAAIKCIVNNISACDEVWVVSKGAGENLRGLGYEGPYRVMENGVDMPKGRACPDRIDAVSAEYGLTDAPVFLFVGRLMWYKGLRLLLDALSLLKNSGHAFTMLFVGDGADREEIEAYAHEAGVAPNCRFTGAIHDREKIRALYSRADLFLFPSTFDTNGLVVREAAACALGSLLISGSCAAEGVENGVSGILVHEDAQEICAVLARLLHDREQMRLIGRNAQEMLYISWDESVRHAYKRYWQVLDDARTGESQRCVTRVDDLFTFQSDWAELLGRIYDGFRKLRKTEKAEKE